MSTQLIGLENLPNVYIEKITLTDNNTETFNVNVNLELYDESVTSGFTWFGACLIYTTDSVVSEGLSGGTLNPLPDFLASANALINKKTGVSVHSLKEFSISNSGTILTFKKTLSFKIRNTENLHIYAFCFLDTKQVSQSFGIDLSDMLATYYGPLSSEKIIVDGKIPTSTSFYANPDNTLWTGPVHQHQNVYMQGSLHSSNPHANVKRITSKNIKTIDNRSKFYSLRQSVKQKTYSLISDSYYSIDHTGGLTGVFSFNMKEFALTKTKYGRKFLKLNNMMFREFVNTIEISSIKINRRQVKLSRAYNKLQTPMIKKIDLGETYTLTSTLESSPGQLIQTNEESAIFKQIYIDSDPMIRSYSFTDLTKNNKSLGDYQYEVEIAIVDKSQGFFDSQIKSAKQNYSNLKDNIDFLNSKKIMTPQ